ncbi:MAG: hypothetical protein HY540_01405 [Deltaproteobacteria bacterium]|nr:hypothetical protein [Deltaproteobacteria bacterium]
MAGLKKRRNFNVELPTKYVFQNMFFHVDFQMMKIQAVIASEPAWRGNPVNISTRKTAHHLSMDEHLKSFVNAAQLCLQTPIKSTILNSNNIFWIRFQATPQIISTSLVKFLMLSRLQEKNMRALAKLDAKYQPFVLCPKNIWG